MESGNASQGDLVILATPVCCMCGMVTRELTANEWLLITA